MTPEAIAKLAEEFRTAYDLPGTDPQAMAGILAGCTVREFVRGDVIFRERDVGTDMYFLLSGRVRATRLDAKGEPLRVADIEAPSIVGHMSLVDGQERSVTVTARTPSVIAVMTLTTFRGLFDSSGPRGSTLRHLLLAAMSEQLSAANDRIRTLIDPRNTDTLDDETTENVISGARAALGGAVQKGKG